MKVCSICQKNYADNDLNFCLDCGGTLNQNSDDDAPPTVMVNSTRQTNPNNWPRTGTQDNQAFGNQGFSNDPFNQQNMGWTPPPAPLQGWQNQPLGSNTPFQPPMAGRMGNDQTLPVISMILGILSITMICCYGIGLPFGVGALVTGYMGNNNANNNPMKYGGNGLAIAGLVTGGIGTLVAIGWIILFIIAALSSK
jgi:hypothetical protein